MKKIKYFSLTLMLLLFTACNSEKELKKEEPSVVAIPTDVNKTDQNITVALPVVTQTYLETVANQYLNELKVFNIDAIVEMTYPALFTVINPTHFREYISIMTNSKDILVESYDTKIQHIDEITTFNNGTQFSQAQYISTAKIIFLNPNLYNTEKSINYLYDVLIHKYGQENIHINLNERSVRISKPEKLLMIKEEGQEWKFLGDNKEYRRLYPQILPAEILNII
jgi:hypothetical protein